MENIPPIDNPPPIENREREAGISNHNSSPSSPSPSSLSTSSSPSSKIQLLIYLIPVIGFFPSLWTLYRRQGSREQLRVSRLSITLAFTWLLTYLLFVSGTGTSESFTLRLLILNSFFTSGYFLVSVWLMLRLIQGKSKRLPGFSSFAETILGKFLT
jgi:hypothetical protein